MDGVEAATNVAFQLAKSWGFSSSVRTFFFFDLHLAYLHSQNWVPKHRMLITKNLKLPSLGLWFCPPTHVYLSELEVSGIAWLVLFQRWFLIVTTLIIYNHTHVSSIDRWRTTEHSIWLWSMKLIWFIMVNPVNMCLVMLMVELAAFFVRWSCRVLSISDWCPSPLGEVVIASPFHINHVQANHN